MSIHRYPEYEDEEEVVESTSEESFWQNYEPLVQTTLPPSPLVVQQTTLQPEVPKLPGHRIPRIIDSGWEDEGKAKKAEGGEAEGDGEQGTEEVLSGQYYEVNPGQYHEVNPGQYHEVNPGQYHEVNPGQYYEVNPGQYNGDMYADQQQQQQQPSSSDDVEVEVEEAGSGRRLYNVQQKVDDFIIGEFGTLSDTNGETLQGVRYTALADSPGVDPQLIFDTLHKFFSFSR